MDCLNLTGRMVAQYRILELVGRGGMGVVYRAIDIRLGRTVALKLLPPGFAETAAKERFLEEARAASSLDHPGICTVFEIDETEDGQLFLAMPYYEGETLEHRIARGPVPLPEAVALTLQVARALARAHESGVIHRDIKPANLIVTRRGEVKILDFGVAKLKGRVGLTLPGIVIGTPAYMAPEQTRGSEIDHRADLWALGVVLYEMVTGQPPFRGDNEHAIFHAVAYGALRPARRLRTDLPEALERVLTRTLEKSPDERYASAQELIADLEAVQAALPSAALTAAAAVAPTVCLLPRPSGIRTGESASWVHRTWSPTPRSAARKGLTAAAVLLPMALALLWLLRPELAKQQGAANGSGDAARPTVLILPFENLGPSEEAYFAAGITEEITSRLVAVRQMRVVSPSTLESLRGKSLREIGEELGIEYVLDGAVRWERPASGPSRVRITPRLIRAADETHVWAARYDQVIDEIFRVQSEVAEQVIAQLGIALLGPERKALQSHSTDSVEAYEWYLRGRSHQVSPGITEPRTWQAAVDAYRKAIEIDPAFAMAWARLSQLYSAAYHLVIDRREERLDQARDAAQAALELQPDLPEGHLALAYYHYWGRRDYTAALRELRIIRQARPNSAEVLEAEGLILRRQGDFHAAADRLEKAFALDPGKADLAINLGSTLLFLRRFDKGEWNLDRAIALSPGSSGPYWWKAYAQVAGKAAVGEALRIADAAPPTEDPNFLFQRIWLDIYARRYPEALARISRTPAKAFQIQDTLYSRSFLEASVQQLAGRTQLARRSWEEARRFLEGEVRSRPDDPGAHSSLGVAYAALGRREDAVREGRTALTMPSVARDSFRRNQNQIHLAWIYTLVGEPGAAVTELEALLRRPSPISVHLLRTDPRWDPLREDPRFRRLLTHGAPGEAAEAVAR